MRADQSKDFEVRERYRNRSEMFSRQQNVQRGGSFHPFPDITLADIFRRFKLVMSKLYVALKYQVYRLVVNFLDGLSLPWFKLGLAALAVFIILKKDVQFSIDMRSPLSVAANEEEMGGADAMSLAQTVGLKGSEATALGVEELEEAKVKAYIRRFTKVAVAEMEKFGMPASIKMAQGILESRAGDHPAARQDNNHFGAPLAGKAYNSAWENWRAHSILLRENHAGLLSEGGDSYRKWARALKAVGYHPDKRYDRKLIDIIEKYQLYLLDEN